MKHLTRAFSLLLVLMFCLSLTTVAFAADVTTTEGMMTEKAEESVNGTLSGYGAHWYNSGEKESGSFDVEVTGMAWLSAHVTFNIEEFDSQTIVFVWLYRPDGTLAYSTGDYSGAGITLKNVSNFADIPFSGGQIGTYTVEYQIMSWNLSGAPSGRINCWIY